jgi:hypothetical protein
MSQTKETIINENDEVIITVTADTGMSGVAIETVGIWYTQKELTQLCDCLQRATSFLNSQEGVQ